jgi:cathepsin L
VAVEANKTVFQSYKSGILNSSACGTNLDHAITAVGYGTESGVDYYIVRNSWGAGWGDKGYIKIAAVKGEGICGI